VVNEVIEVVQNIQPKPRMKPESQDSALQIYKTANKPHVFNKAERSAQSKSFQKAFLVNIITIPLLIHITLLVKIPLPFTVGL